MDPSIYLTDSAAANTPYQGTAAAPVTSPQQAFPANTTALQDVQTTLGAPPPSTVRQAVVTGRTSPKYYDNSSAAQSLNNAENSEPPVQGGGVNSGIWGLLPQNLQHGTLRNILGGVGDAFLLAGHSQPRYEQRMENERLGQLAATGPVPTTDADGNPLSQEQIQENQYQSQLKAIARVGGSNIPGAFEQAQKMREILEQERIRQATVANTAAYREGTLAERTQYHDAELARQQGVADDRKRQLVGGILASAARTGDQSKYDQARARVLTMIQGNKGIDPSEFPENINDFSNGYGLTAGQSQAAYDKGEGRKVSMRDTDVNANAKITSAHVGAAARAPQPNDNTERRRLAGILNNGGQLTPADQQIWSRLTNVRGGSRAPLHPAAISGGTTPQRQQPQFQNGQTYTDAHGNRAKYQNGQWIPQ